MTKRLIVVCALVSLLLAGSLYAEQLRTTVSFPFFAGDKLLPAGDYTFTWDSKKLPGIVTVVDSSGNTQEMVIVGTLPERTSAGVAATVFDQTGDYNSISQIWFPRHIGFVIGQPAAAHARKTQHKADKIS